MCLASRCGLWQAEKAAINNRRIPMKNLFFMGAKVGKFFRLQYLETLYFYPKTNQEIEQ
jgi:hypothetical protein